ncbi:Peroxisome biogenesis protein 22 [Striga hermonthica]|uniref:Peroxisome biogenesis protein 22 n=1 Tax=Striga hermonthica TaxID=68872 RepID=A0A9N7NYT5_STRHE|nr:Peroxisome biogenesis protein 22 [Striga hermonthica]
MADNSKEDFLQLVKRVGAFVSLKISTLLRSLDSRSFGAIAGLAFAVIFTWKFLRPSRGTPRRLPKRQAPSTSNSGEREHPTTFGVSNPPGDSRTQNVVDETFQPVNASVSQTVRQRLSQGRKVTCSLLGVILEETSPEELQKQATVRSSVLDVLLEITRFNDLYLMERVLDDESEKKVLAALEDAGAFASGGLVKDKVLFCSTENGRASFVRQLEPDWHIDSDLEIVTQLSRFIKSQLLVSPSNLKQPAPNVYSASSLEQFFRSA